MLVDAVSSLRIETNIPDFIIGYRLSPEEYETPGITLEDSTFLIKALTQTDIDYIHLSLGSLNNRQSEIYLIREPSSAS